jgi:PAS domain S-box-containing protein
MTPDNEGPEIGLNKQLLLTIMQEISRDAVLSLDAEGRITNWNQGAEQLLGYTPEEVMGRHFRFLVPQDLIERGELDRLVDETELHGFLRDYETRRITRAGSEIHVSLTRLRQLDPDGNLLGATAILRDITRRKQMEEELINTKTLAAIGEFAARIAHEVKNPLTGMSSALSLISSSIAGNHAHAPIFEEIQRQVRRIDRVLDDLLTFARHRPVDRQQVDLVQLLEKVLDLLKAGGDLDRITIKRYLPEEALVYADPTMLEDSFFNLLQNATQSMQTQGRGLLTLAVKPGPRGVAITISDDGPGIPADILTTIFDPFFTTKVRGTGLGLPITRKHIEAHGGRLRVRSAPGKVTTFEILLPLDSIAASLDSRET